MALPTEDEIREQARKLHRMDLPEEIRYKVPPPEDYELREGGYWYRAQRELMTGERRRMEEELERWEALTEPEKVELRERFQVFDLTLSSLEKDWQEYLKKEALKPRVEVRPRRFSVGDTVARGEQEGKVKGFRWDEAGKRWVYLVERGPEEEWVPEEELAYVWKAPPEAVPPPKVERPPRVPRAPPPPVEFVCPSCKRPLEPITELSWSERVPIMERPEPGFPEIFTGRYEEERYTRKIPEAELVFMCFNIPACPYGGMYFKVRHGRMMGPVAKSEVVRQILAPPPVPRVPRAPVTTTERILREVQEHTWAVEADPEFRKYVETEVGLAWSAYLRQDPWAKLAIRQEFIKRETKVG